MKNLSIITILFSLALILSCSETQEQKTDLTGQEVEYISEGTILKGFLVYDKKFEGKRPGVLVVHEWWGHNDYVRDRARMLAELGYTALALESVQQGADDAEDGGILDKPVTQTHGAVTLNRAPIFGIGAGDGKRAAEPALEIHAAVVAEPHSLAAHVYVGRVDDAVGEGEVAGGAQKRIGETSCFLP